MSSFLSRVYYMLVLTTYTILLVSSQTSNPTFYPTYNPTSNPITANPTSNPTTHSPSQTPTSTTETPTFQPTTEPTYIPTMEPTTPTQNPTDATPIPTINQNFCNLFNGKAVENTIQVTQNHIISNIDIDDPLVIEFNFIISENTCTTTHNKTCNLIQFGRYDSTADDDISFPRISTINNNGTLYWKIVIDDGINSVTLYNKDNTVQKSAEFFAIQPNTNSSFHITFSEFERAIYIGSELFYYNLDNETDFENITNQSHPFYVSMPGIESLKANISDLCISTGSFSPTFVPTKEPTKLPTIVPTATPTNQSIFTTEYQKIHCYTETGQLGDRTVSCREDNYMIISCGLINTNPNIIDDNNGIFYKGAYIERRIINDLSSDGICYVNYNSKSNNITQFIKPQARCCNFQQQYNDGFKCRYFKSQDDFVGTMANDRYFSTEEAAITPNEFTFVTCPTEFPLLMSCSTRLNEDSKVISQTESINDIQFYGAFYAELPVDGQYNPDYNKYFELNTGINSEKRIPFAPTESTTPSPLQRDIDTPSPTYTPTGSATELQLNISDAMHCVAQYGNKKGNYTITAVATCCTEQFDTDTKASSLSQSTTAPTAAPTMKTPLVSKLFGTNGTNTGKFYIENEESKAAIVGIETWAIYQIQDSNTVIINTVNQSQKSYNINYQAVVIGEYKTIDSNGSIESRHTSSAYGVGGTGWDSLFECASFFLDLDKNGNRDYINGFDVYWTHIAVFGLTFHTAFGRKYSCPDHENFEDTSIARIVKSYENEKDTPNYNTIAPSYYNINIGKERDLFAANGTYRLSGWKGWLQTRNLGVGVSRSVYGSISFLFIGEPFINTPEPTPGPTDIPTTLIGQKTQSPTFIGQELSESLKCYTIWGNQQIKCQNNIYDTMIGCGGYSVEGQIFNTYINNNDQCIAETINNKSIAAIGTCCYFYQTPPRNFNVFIYTSIFTATIFFALFIFITSCLFWNIKKIVYFDDDDVDDDTKIDEALENVGEGVASNKIAKFKVTETDHAEMVQLARKNSGSTGLQL